MAAHERVRRLEALLDELHSTLDPVSDEQLAEIRWLWPTRDPRELAVRLRGGRDEGFVADGAVSPLPEGASLDDMLDELVRRAAERGSNPSLTEAERLRRQREVFDLVDEALEGSPSKR
jgi:hypothetical protein